MNHRFTALGALAMMSVASFASGAIVDPGQFQLHNHPDGAMASPFYGLRLDELYDATSGHDNFTFDFDHEMSDMRMDVTESSIHIHGVSWGGRDIGSGYADDQYRGVYRIDFMYDLGVERAPGDDDFRVDGVNHANLGSIVTPLQDEIRLEDERGNHGYSFRLGDEDNDNGHRGFDGISGWGWMNHGPEGSTHVYSSDWLFTATPVPTPGAAALAAAGGLLCVRRRRDAK